MTRLLLLLLLFGNISYGQTTIKDSTTILTYNIISDTLNSSPNKAFNDKIKLAQIDQSKAKVDIRLYTLHLLSNTNTIRRFFLVDTTWAAVEFDEWNKPVKIKKYKLKPTPSSDSLFLRLLSFNIMTLPNQLELKDKMHKDVQGTNDEYKTERKFIVTDGENYTIEIKIGNKFRIYQFDNPEPYSKFYDNISELKDYFNIVQTFDKYLQRE